MSVTGLCGAHRTGKTSLARAFAKKHGIVFMETSVSAIFKELGQDPAASFDFTTRLDIQEVILERLDAMYGLIAPGSQVVVDRTPIDMLAYTMAEAIGHVVSDADQARFVKYTERCFDVINRRFATLVLVQPGIPLVDEEGKAAINQAYIEHLNSLMLGLTVDERVKCSHFYILRALTDMDDRLTALESAYRQSGFHVRQQKDLHLSSGGFLQ
jgi:predicted ATPase